MFRPGPSTNEDSSGAECRDLLKTHPIASDDPHLWAPERNDANAIRLPSGEKRAELSMRVEFEKGCDSTVPFTSGASRSIR